MNLDYQAGFNAGTAFARKYEVTPLITGLRNAAGALECAVRFVPDGATKQETVEFCAQLRALVDRISSKDEQEIVPRF